MNKFKKLYRDFFGLTEQTTKLDKTKDVVVSAAVAKDPVKLKVAQDVLKATKGRLHIEEESEIDEAQLINHMTDYQGGIEYVLRNPSEAQSVAEEIKQWSEKKGFVIAVNKISKNGKIGYFYFRLGQDPALESQKIQGYIAQKPEVKHFRFNVRGQQEAPVQSEPVAKPPMRTNPNI